jgi:NADH-quinone oxidoreductase subunit J
MSTDLIVFLGLAIVAIVSGLGMLFGRNAVYSALFLILNFSAVAVFYLILSAPFIALAQITVYAGAIMVLFLFVIMLLGAEQIGRTPSARWLKPTALILGVIMLAETVYIIFTYKITIPELAEVGKSFGSPTEIGEALFNQYLLPFEMTSILLLAAMIGAIVLTKHHTR